MTAGVILLGVGYAAITATAVKVLGNGPAVVIGVVLAGVAVWVFRLLDKVLAKTRGLDARWKLADWMRATLLGLLLMHGTWFFQDAFTGLVVLVHGGFLRTPILTFLGGTVIGCAGFLVGGVFLGRLVPSQALYSSALGSSVTSFLELVRTWSGHEFDPRIGDAFGIGSQQLTLEDVRIGIIVSGVIRVLFAVWGAYVGSKSSDITTVRPPVL